MSGKLRSEKAYKDSKPDGVWKYYDEIENLAREEIYKDVEYVSTVAEEVKKEYYPTGQLRRETPYKMGKKDGIEREYDFRGKLKLEIPYKDGLKNGVEKGYCSDTETLWSEISYKEGKLDGIYRVYSCVNGNLNIEGSYRNDKKDGAWKRYYVRSGMLMSEEYYKNGEAVGTSKYYDENGNLERETPHLYIPEGEPMKFQNYTLLVEKRNNHQLTGVQIYNNIPYKEIINAKSGEYIPILEKNEVKLKLVDGIVEERDPENPDVVKKMKFKIYFMTLKTLPDKQ